MAYTDAVKNDMLDDLSTLATHASLHTADPGTTGASEVSGGSYARVAITWASASGASKTLTAAVAIQVPAGTTVTHAGTWSAISAGTFRAGGTLPASQSFPTGGVYILNLTATLT